MVITVRQAPNDPKSFYKNKNPFERQTTLVFGEQLKKPSGNY